MRRSLIKLLEDIRAGGTGIQVYTQGMSESGYLENQVVRRAVEREFEIIGEALRRISSEFPEAAEGITSSNEIIAFRNILAHGYDVIDDVIVWSIVEKRLPTLLDEVSALMEKETAPQ